MASIFRPAGKKKYIINYTDESGRRRKKVGSTDKTVTLRIARDIENRVALRRDGVIDAKADAILASEATHLGAHLAAWRKSMADAGRTEKHSKLYADRVGKLIAIIKGSKVADVDPGRKPEAQAKAERTVENAAAAARLSDLSPERIRGALAALREAGKANQTASHYRAAMRAFVRWCIETGRMRDNPMVGVKGFNAEEDVRHARRNLTADELAGLIRAAEGGPVTFGMTGAMRAMAYRVAAATGFRVAELRSLTPESFRLAGDEPIVVLKASSTKNRRPAQQPVSVALAGLLREWLRDKPAGRLVFPLHHETARAMRRDLEVAGIPYSTDDGVADFHSLRGYFISAISRTGASIKTLATLARHANPATTLKHYTRVERFDLRGAVESMDPTGADSPRNEALAATGTDPKPSATRFATRAIETSRNVIAPQDVTDEQSRFAKPL